jgi:hypothetical protein
MYYISIILVSLFFNFSNTNSYYAKRITTEHRDQNKGRVLLKKYCYSCHNPKASESDRIAPPMIAVKKHYKKSNTTQEEFIASIQNWIKNPIKENSRMTGAIGKFGIMPKQYFSDETIREISIYMYNNNIEKPKWFDEHHKNKSKNHNKQTKH